MGSQGVNWPKYFLVGHAIELALWGFIRLQEDRGIPRPDIPEPGNHDLMGLYEYAVAYGLPRDQLVTERLPHLSELHKSHHPAILKSREQSL
jgi:hypothetical protein